MTGPVYVGRVDCTTASESFPTLEAGEKRIAEIALNDPEGVERGDYYIDVSVCAECGEPVREDDSPGVLVHDEGALGARAYDLNEDHVPTVDRETT